MPSLVGRVLGMAFLTQERLKEILSYNPETGEFIHLLSRGKGKKGRVAGSVHPTKEYRYIRIEGKNYFSHRLAWFYVYGEWPQDQIDHIDGNRLNNRIENLRDVTNAENRRNTKRQSNNTSGVTGVRRRKNHRKWEARIKVNRRCIHLGYFNDMETARRVRKEAEKRYGFHENHGREA